MPEKMKIPKSINWVLSPREHQKVEFLYEATGITQGTQLVSSAITRWYNELQKDRAKYVQANELS